jgi:hypothetical protein
MEFNLKNHIVLEYYNIETKNCTSIFLTIALVQHTDNNNDNSISACSSTHALQASSNLTSSSEAMTGILHLN